MGVALCWRAERLGMVFAAMCASPLILVLWPQGLTILLRVLVLSLGATLGYMVQACSCPDADYLFLRGVTRPQMLASAWVRAAIVGLLFWIDWAIALRASAGAVTRDQAEMLLLALATSLLAASVTKPGSWLSWRGGKKPVPAWTLRYWLLTNVIPVCVSYVLFNLRSQGRDLYPVICLYVLAATPLCALVTLRAWKRSDLAPRS